MGPSADTGTVPHGTTHWAGLRSGLAGDAPVGGHPTRGDDVVGAGPPLVHVDQAGRHQVQPLEEPGYLGPGARVDGAARWAAYRVTAAPIAIFSVLARTCSARAGV